MEDVPGKTLSRLGLPASMVNGAQYGHSLLWKFLPVLHRAKRLYFLFVYATLFDVSITL
jgi:hypothetical protein